MVSKAEAVCNSFSISAIPHTVAQTVLQDRKKGDPVNLETDIIGKYVEKLLYAGAPLPGTTAASGAGAQTASGKASGGITRDFLMRNGF